MVIWGNNKCKNLSVVCNSAPVFYGFAELVPSTSTALLPFALQFSFKNLEKITFFYNRQLFPLLTSFYPEKKKRRKRKERKRQRTRGGKSSGYGGREGMMPLLPLSVSRSTKGWARSVSVQA